MNVKISLSVTAIHLDTMAAFPLDNLGEPDDWLAKIWKAISNWVDQKHAQMTNLGYFAVTNLSDIITEQNHYKSKFAI